MYKLLIADDEEIEISAFKIIVANNFSDIEVFTVANGFEAIEISKSILPDIVFLDIKMPGIDGIQTMEEILKIHPGAKIIIHSAYGVFEYAQRAIQLGAYDYMLKPTRIDNIIETLEKIKNEIKAEKKKVEEIENIKNAIFRYRPIIEKNIVFSVINNNIYQAQFQEVYSEFLDGKLRFAYCLALRLHSKNAERYSEDVLELIERLKQICKCIVAEYSKERIMCIVFSDEIDEEKNYRTGGEIARYLIKMIQGKLTMEIGIGPSCVEFEELNESYIKACKALKSITEGTNTFKYYNELETQEGEWLPANCKEEFCFSILGGDKRGSCEICEEYFNRILNLYEGNYLKIKLVLLESILFLKSYIEKNFLIALENRQEKDMDIEEIAGIQSLQKWFCESVRNIVACVKSRNIRKNSEIVSMLINYIETNIGEEISLDILAKTFFISPYYLSKIFKKETGINFSNYLNKIRIEKAKVFLINTNKSLRDVYLDVGFNSQAYFCRVFKKSTGYMPGEYRKIFSCDPS